MSKIDERIVYEGRPSWLNYYLLYIAGTVLCAILGKAGYIEIGLLMLVLLISLAGILRLRYKFYCNH